MTVSDAALSDRIRRVAAASGRASTHLSALPDRSTWNSAEILVMSPSFAHDAAAHRYAAHPAVVVVTDGAADVDAWRAAALLGTAHVLELPAAEGRLMSIFGSTTRESSGDGVVVAVMGGCGGGGASVFATALAMVASRTGRSILVDGDISGGGIDLVAGLDEVPGLRWPELVIDGGNVDAAALHHALPGSGDLAVLSTRRHAVNVIGQHALSAVFVAGRSAGEVVVCDTPRVSGDVHRSVVETADLVVVLTPATVRSAAAARIVAESVGTVCANVGVVVRGPSPGGLTAADVADIVGVPLLASVRSERRLAAALDGHGLVLGRRSPLAEAATSVLSLLSESGGVS
ncbi:MAG: septum site-determining protein Ssd [Rhodococcus sp. (in: high G+C Gram-positive bacteria)]